VQGEGEYMYYPGRREGQINAALLYRRHKLQFGVATSFKDARLRSEDTSGTLSHAVFNLEVLLPKVRFGIFDAKGLHEVDVVTPGSPERILHTIDQFGGDVQFGVLPVSWIDANVVYLHRYTPGLGGTGGAAVRYSHQLVPGVAFTAQFDINESFVGPNTTGTVTFGVTLGRRSRPPDYSNPINPLGMTIPRVHYEVFPH